MINMENYMDYLKGYSVLLIDGDSCGCAGCYALGQELQPVCISKNINYMVINASEIDEEFAKKYEIVSYPIALLFKSDQLLGKIKGYQPAEILDIWLDSKMK